MFMHECYKYHIIYFLLKRSFRCIFGISDEARQSVKLWSASQGISYLFLIYYLGLAIP